MTTPTNLSSCCKVETSVHIGEYFCTNCAKPCTISPAENKQSVNAEEWLNSNCKQNDWAKLEEGLNDSLWTSNVIQYMTEYSNTVNAELMRELNQHRKDGYYEKYSYEVEQNQHLQSKIEALEKQIQLFKNPLTNNKP